MIFPLLEIIGKKKNSFIMKNEKKNFRTEEKFLMGYCPFCGLGAWLGAQARAPGVLALGRWAGRWALGKAYRRAGSRRWGARARRWRVRTGAGVRQALGVRACWASAAGGRERRGAQGRAERSERAQQAAGSRHRARGACGRAGARGRRGRAERWAWARGARGLGVAWCAGWASRGLMQPVWFLTWVFDSGVFLSHRMDSVHEHCSSRIFSKKKKNFLNLIKNQIKSNKI